MFKFLDGGGLYLLLSQFFKSQVPSGGGDGVLIW